MLAMLAISFWFQECLKVRCLEDAEGPPVQLRRPWDIGKVEESKTSAKLLHQRYEELGGSSVELDAEFSKLQIGGTRCMISYSVLK